MTLNELQKKVVGLYEKVVLLDGSRIPYVNFDNASSTPTFLPVQQKVDEFCKWYSNVHRGTGFKSQISSWVFEEARDTIAKFVNADEKSSVIFCKNTTEAINKLAGRFRCPAAGGEKPVILTTIMEHHSNELPWRQIGEVIHVGLNPDGTIDITDFDEKLRKYRGLIQLVAVTGASNVTGYINPIHDLARKAHSIGAEIVIDAAQLAPHRPIDVRPSTDPEHLDYVAFSAHKMYAPYGIGVLVTTKNIFKIGAPQHVGGGTVDIVSLESVYWKDLPEREEAGTPDIIGVVALAKVIMLINEVGFQSIIDHEAKLTSYALKKLSEMPEVIIYGERNPEKAHERLGVIALNIEGINHALAAAILSYEGGIGVRNGCFCAHPYVKRLLGVDREDAKKVEEYILARDRSKIPGTIRVSFGLYNATEEIDHLCEMIKMIIEKKYKGKYLLNKERGDYYPEGFEMNFPSFFHL
ncbi:MAG: aminotransferase class V-fold PLP-dependent enzyme [bacterium]